MFYSKSTQDRSWYKTEARRLGHTELYELHTTIGGSILQATNNVEQLVLTNTSDTVEAYFTSSASRADLENHFDETVSKINIDPLTLWSEHNTAGSAYQIENTSRSDEIEPQLMDINKNLTVLKKLITRLERENNDPSVGYPSRFVSISIMSNPTKDGSTGGMDSEPPMETLLTE